MNQQHEILFKEIKQAFRVVWIVISIAGLFTILIATFLNKETILHISPTCVSIKYFHKECFLCGMTRAFLDIGRFNFFDAYLLNKGSVFLFFVIMVNSILFITFNVVNIRRYLIKSQFNKSIFKLKF